MYSEKFINATDELLPEEGLYSNDPDDPGGETKYGISKRSYPDLDIRNLTKEQAIEIYHRDFWMKNRLEEIEDWEIALQMLEMAVNMGPHAATDILQRAINDCEAVNIEVDGAIGPMTIAAVNACTNKHLLIDEIMLGAIRFYLSLKKPKYLAGWITRVLS